MSIGSQIAARRKQIGLTQLALADKLNVSFQAVSSWERDEYLPETEKLKILAKALNTTVSYLMEEEAVSAKQWHLQDAMFSVENMLRRVRMYAQAKKMVETQKAIRIMLKYHEGTTRKSIIGEQIPYVIHPLIMACHAFALGIDSDDLIATILLHDVLEDCDISANELDINDNIRKTVILLTYVEDKDMSRGDLDKRYYKAIADNKIASIVKLLDRCNNISTMATGFTTKKMIEYIEETETYIFPLLETVKHNYDDYYDATFLLKYQLLSVIESLKRTI